MTSPPPDPLVGHTFDGRYVIRSRVARGGMAMVYVANDLRLERRVAVKVMHAHLAEDEAFTRRFEQEARSAAGLQHPNIVSVFDQGHDAGLPYLVMEYLPGITLRELLKQQKKLTSEQAMEVSEAVLSGLAAAHAAGIVHRDLKPENVLMGDDGQIKIADFGLARAVSANTTTGQALLGTIAYLSPELVTRGIADARSDLYAFGIMLYEMITGRQPYQGEQPMQIAYQHAHSDVPAPSLIEPDSTYELDELVTWTTRRDPDERPPDASYALDYLKQVQAGHPAATRMLPQLTDGDNPTPSTTVLDEFQQDELASTSVLAQSGNLGVAGKKKPKQRNRSTTGSPRNTDRAQSAARKRSHSGRIIAILLTLLLAATGGAAWWFGQGPGSLVAVPDLGGRTQDAATAELAELTLKVNFTECSSLEVDPGLVVRTQPQAGTRVARDSVVRACTSTGPAMLPVPVLAGLTIDEAETAISKAGFVFGEVTEQIFDDGSRGTVVEALGNDGEPLSEHYPEQGVIDLVASAGSLPRVEGTPVDTATATLENVGLAVDPELNSESYHEEIPEGQVIRALYQSETVRVGDSVGLEISKGPELFPVPDVAGMKLQAAMDALAAAGFSPNTAFPDEWRDLAKATGTNPAAGTELRAGADVRVTATISL